jgi:hypothetical protein
MGQHGWAAVCVSLLLSASIRYGSRFSGRGCGGGLSVQNSLNITGNADSVSQIFYDAGRLYDLLGYVRDAASGAVLGQFQMPGNQSTQNPPNDQIVAVVPETAQGRVFYLVHNLESEHLLLYNFDSTTYALQSVADLEYDEFDVSVKTRMIHLGTDGLATNRVGLQLLSGSLYAAPANPEIQQVRRVTASGPLFFALRP